MDDARIVYPETQELFRKLMHQMLGERSARRSDSAYTFQAFDGSVLFTSGSAITATIPADIFPIDYVLTGVQLGAGAVTFAAGAGVTLNSNGSKVATNGQYAVASAKQIADNVWLLFGNLA